MPLPPAPPPILASLELPPAFVLLAVTLLGVVLVSLVLLKFRQSLLIAYFLCGIVIANSGVLGASSGELAKSIPHLAEFGVLLLLFTLGLEFSLGEIKYLGRAAFLGGSMQVSLTMLLAAVGGWAMGLQGTHLVVFCVTMALSSTAISVKVYQDRGISSSPGARFALAIAIFQDIFIIGFLVLLPLLLPAQVGAGKAAVASQLTSVVIKGILFVAASYMLARWVIPRLLHAVARSQSRELFTLTVIGLCLGVALLAGVLELSLALGAFVAGLAVSESIYKHRILADIMPLKDLFLTLFFVSVGLMIDLPSALRNAPAILALAGILLLVKATLIFLIAHRMGLRPKPAMYSALGLASAGEFSLVLTQKVTQLAPWPPGSDQILLAAMALSMGIVPLIVGRAETWGAWIEKRIKPSKSPAKSHLPPAKRVRQLTDHAIVCGYGPVGKRVVRNLSREGIQTVVIELNVDTVKKLAATDQPVLFADAKHQETWPLAGVQRARLVIFSFPDSHTVAEALPSIRALKPDIAVISRCKYASDADRLKRLGVNAVILDEDESGKALLREAQGIFTSKPDNTENPTGAE